ncbi:hypothetical protein BB561_004040 [Smittium simulii]|uniref:Uncharacterized protein n=1 Tax=Smittium simulii TaxID=133385 RepID=A0A2T9YID5_9FUNG|nr:hypothetical protein BB561_004040 [Smittium simulii]
MYLPLKLRYQGAMAFCKLIMDLGWTKDPCALKFAEGLKKPAPDTQTLFLTFTDLEYYISAKIAINT